MMKKEEKYAVYSLLKTASDALYGFSSPSFPSEMPNFEDDILTESSEQKMTETAGGTPAEMQSANNESAASGSATLDSIAKKIAACNRCVLSKTRLNVVPGMGVPNPFVLVIGEGPGEEEDKQGLPFVGPAGQLLDKMLAAIQLSRAKNTYIANIVKCRPPMNRNPFPEEADACRSFLDAQIAALKPKAILAAGSVAVKNLLHTQAGVLKLHGKIMDYKGIPLLTTYHPSALLRAPENKRTAWEDLKIFRAKLLEIDPNYAN